MSYFKVLRNFDKPLKNCPSNQWVFNNSCINFVGFDDFCKFQRHCNFLGLCQQNKCNCGINQIFDSFKCILNPVQQLITSKIVKFKY